MGQALIMERPEHAPISASQLREVMRNYVTGVCVVSTYSEVDGIRRHNAVTVNSLTSVSLDPPLLSVSFGSNSSFLPDLMQSGVLGISILGSDAENVARVFAGNRTQRQEALQRYPSECGGQTGSILIGGPGWIECRYRNQLRVGDHVMVIVEAVGAAFRDPKSLLLFVQGGFRHLEVSARHNRPQPPGRMDLQEWM